MKRLHLPLLVLFLTLTGVGLAWYKYQVYGFPLTPNSHAEAWVVEAQINFKTQGQATTVRLDLPDHPPNFSVLNEGFVSRGWGLTTQTDRQNRLAVWTKRKPGGEQTLYYRLTAYANKEPIPPSPYPGPADQPTLEKPLKSAGEALVSSIRAHSADIETFATLLIKELNQPKPNENLAAFLQPGSSDAERVRVAIKLLALARIPARISHGIRLTASGQDIHPATWLEIHNSRKWVPINPKTGKIGYPKDFLVWWYGDQPVVSGDQAKAIKVRFSTTRAIHDAIDVAKLQASTTGSRLVEFSLLNLPVSTQNTYRILLMVPLGALIIVLLRNVVGIRTFGTFMPVLIALSFRETHLLGGLVLFTLIVALGLMVRFYMEHLKLLLVPRLAAVVIVVVMLMALLSIVSYRLGIDLGLSVSLFPMVILAMTIERISLVWEEHGPGDALLQGAGSLAVASLSYVIMINPYIEHLFYTFPELLLAVLAMTLLLGRYTGYRLTELWRFRAFKTLAQDKGDHSNGGSR